MRLFPRTNAGNAVLLATCTPINFAVGLLSSDRLGLGVSMFLAGAGLVLALDYLARWADERQRRA